MTTYDGNGINSHIWGIITLRSDGFLTHAIECGQDVKASTVFRYLSLFRL